VKVLVEQDVIAPVRIFLERPGSAVHRPPPIAAWHWLCIITNCCHRIRCPSFINYIFIILVLVFIGKVFL
jgi:hypothetical protein